MFKHRLRIARCRRPTPGTVIVDEHAFISYRWSMDTHRQVIGVISDTHGLLRPSAVAALQGADAIVHAGDIGSPEVLSGLGMLGPVTAVRGNVDLGWAGDLPETAVLQLAGRRFLVVHNLKELEFDPRAAGFDAVISGHSHQPKVDWRNKLLYVNPGSAGARRFRLPIAVARIEMLGDSIEARIILLAE
jgi:uncharacterized protein